MSTLTPREVEPGSAWRWVKEAFYLFFSHPIKWGLFYAFTILGYYVLSLNTSGSFFLTMFPVMTFSIFTFTIGLRLPAICENLLTKIISLQAITWFFFQTVVIFILIAIFSIFTTTVPPSSFFDVMSPLISFSLSAMVCQYYTTIAIKEVLLISYEAPWSILGNNLAESAVSKNLSEMRKITVVSALLLLVVLFGNTPLLKCVSLLFGPLLCYIHIMVRDIFMGPTRYENVTHLVPSLSNV